MQTEFGMLEGVVGKLRNLGAELDFKNSVSLKVDSQETITVRQKN